MAFVVANHAVHRHSPHESYHHEQMYTPLQQEDTGSFSILALDSADLDRQIEADQKMASMREWWKKTHNVDSVKPFLKNYKNHPAGWGALLMIHGIPEVTGRLRSKVENFAIYSALFLATAVTALLAPPDSVMKCTGFECEARKRIFTYCLLVGVVAQVLCIMLAMAFGNALNEAARDSDVFRMFSPAGNAYFATRKCELAYETGVATTCVAMLAAVQSYMGWEPVIFSGLIVPAAAYVYKDTSSKLFASASIVDYWKSGKAGPSDPYDLDLFIEAYEHMGKGGSEKGNGSVASRKEPFSRDLEAPPESSGNGAFRSCSKPNGRGCLG